MSYPSANINIDNFPVPQVVQVESASDIRDRIIARCVERMQLHSPDFSSPLVSDPGYQYADAVAYRISIHQQRVNEAALSTMLAYANGDDLDNIALNFRGVERLVVTEEDLTVNPPIDAVMESDEDFLYRIVLAPESYTTAGSKGSYEFWALSADGDIADIEVLSPAGCEIELIVLAREGEADDSLLAKVKNNCSGEDRVPWGDRITVIAAELVSHNIVAELVFYESVSASAVQQAHDDLEEFLKSSRKIGFDITESALHNALHQKGVKSVNLQGEYPLEIDETQAANCTFSITSSVAGDV